MNFLSLFFFFFGSFMPIHTGAETDLRFIYCAGKRKTKDDLILLLSCVNKTYSKRYFGVSAAICSMLESWSGMDREKAKEYISNCQVCIINALVLHRFISFKIIFGCMTCM